MRCYVINLDRDVGRWNDVDARLTAAGIAHERISAALGSALDSATLAAHRAGPGPKLSDGEVGCIMSHVTTLREFLASDETTALVLEDDVHVGDDAHAFLETAQALLADFDIVKLEATRMVTKISRRATRVGGRRVHVLKAFHLGTAAYLVGRTGAAKVLAQLEVAQVPCDLAIFAPEHSPLRAAQIAPAPFIQEGFMPGAKPASTIGLRESHVRKRPSPLRRLKPLANHLYNVLHAFSDTKRARIRFG